jgi:hypothetical protein
MRIYENGVYRDLTPAEIAEMEAQAAETERQYWQTTTYDDAVDAEIRKRYTVSQEFAILRQKDEKPEEYAEYYAYCEECKAYVKAKKSATIGGDIIYEH